MMMMMMMMKKYLELNLDDTWANLVHYFEIVEMLYVLLQQQDLDLA
jgi:hypothetical protein